MKFNKIKNDNLKPEDYPLQELIKHDEELLDEDDLND